MKPDWHRYNEQLLANECSVKKNVSSEKNKETIFSLEKDLIVRGITKPRIIKYLYSLKLIDQYFKKMTKDASVYKEICDELKIQPEEINDIENENDDFVTKPELEVQHIPAKQENFKIIETPKIEMHIDVDKLLSTPLHLAITLLPEECDILERNKYQKKNFVSLGKTKPETFYIKECKPEGLEHTFVVHSIVHELKDRGVTDIQTHTTQKPDITFSFDNKQYALEIETPLYLKKKHKRLQAKTQTNNQHYGTNCWFVTTQSAYAKSFRKYGKVLTRNQIHDWIDKITPD